MIKKYMIAHTGRFEASCFYLLVAEPSLITQAGLVKPSLKSEVQLVRNLQIIENLKTFPFFKNHSLFINLD